MNSGYDVLDIKRRSLQISDIEIMEIAREESRVILTRDKDYIILAQFPKYQVPIIVIRLINQTRAKHIADKVLEFIKNTAESTIQNSLTIIKEEIASSYRYPFIDI